ncbi:MAG: hypothetical protein IT324_31680 [Anaerolineae bacterium]|nr:hypothetical protein [Anaerolineae bacterium]
MPYYPEHSFILGLTTIRRERRLPPGAVNGEIMVRDRHRVEAPTEVLIRGAVSGDYVILDIRKPLGLRPGDELSPSLFQVQPGNVVTKGTPLAVRGEGRRAKAVKAPVDAVVARIDGDQIILQANPEQVEVTAMCPGEVTSVRPPNEVLLETTGALLQCAWGNGKRAYTTFRLEPDEGIESMKGNPLMAQFRSTGILMPRQIQSTAVFSAALDQEITAIIAPSLRSSLREAALRQTIPIILTEGFGDQRMSEAVYNLLAANQGRPALIDATEPERWSSHRPEIIIPLPTGGTRPKAPDAEQALAEGTPVRITRAPYAGLSGVVQRISPSPRTIENGLRVPGADVQLSSGKIVFIPLANLEMLGRAGDAPGAGDF